MRAYAPKPAFQTAMRAAVSQAYCPVLQPLPLDCSGARRDPSDYGSIVAPDFIVDYHVG